MALLAIVLYVRVENDFLLTFQMGEFIRREQKLVSITDARSTRCGGCVFAALEPRRAIGQAAGWRATEGVLVARRLAGRGPGPAWSLFRQGS